MTEHPYPAVPVEPRKPTHVLATLIAAGPFRAVHTGRCVSVYCRADQVIEIEQSVVRTIDGEYLHAACAASSSAPHPTYVSLDLIQALREQVAS